MEDLVRVVQVYDEDGEKVRVSGLITKQAHDYLVEMLEKEPKPISQDRKNNLIDQAAEKFPEPEE